jgi:hypothetical protein
MRGLLVVALLSAAGLAQAESSVGGSQLGSDVRCYSWSGSGPTNSWGACSGDTPKAPEPKVVIKEVFVDRIVYVDRIVPAPVPAPKHVVRRVIIPCVPVKP